MNKASQGSSVSRRFTTASRHSQTFELRGEPKGDPAEDAALFSLPDEAVVGGADVDAAPRRRRRPGSQGSAPPMRRRRRPIPPAIGDANAWLMTIRRAPSACSREKTAPFGSRLIDSPVRLTIRLRPKSSMCGVVRTAVGDPDMASFVHPSSFRVRCLQRMERRSEGFD